MASNPVEISVKHVTTVDSLPEAWAFVMDRLDLLGPRPTVEIRPVYTSPRLDEPERYHFSVLVSAMHEEAVGSDTE